MPYLARSELKRRSAIEAMSMPAPTAAPLTAAMYGFSMLNSARGTRWTELRRLLRLAAGAFGSPPSTSPPARSRETSAPEQKPRPAPVTISTRTPWSWLALVM